MGILEVLAEGPATSGSLHIYSIVNDWHLIAVELHRQRSAHYTTQAQLDTLRQTKFH